VTGEYNYLMKVATKDSADMDRLIKLMQDKMNVSNTDTLIVLNTCKREHSIMPE
jgi:DNA-binding Lrp family transcriptional regulator